MQIIIFHDMGKLYGIQILVSVNCSIGTRPPMFVCIMSVAAFVSQGQSRRVVTEPVWPTDPNCYVAVYVKKFFQPCFRVAKNILFDCKLFEDKGHFCVSATLSNVWLFGSSLNIY